MKLSYLHNIRRVKFDKFKKKSKEISKLAKQIRKHYEKTN